MGDFHPRDSVTNPALPKSYIRRELYQLFTTYLFLGWYILRSWPWLERRSSADPD